MADMIGNQSFQSVVGSLDKLAPAFEDASRPNTNGRAFKYVGNRGDMTQIVAGSDYLSAAAATTALATYKGMQGTAVSIQQYGQSRGTFFIVNVIEKPRQTGVIAVGGMVGGTHFMETVWTVGAVA